MTRRYKNHILERHYQGFLAEARQGEDGVLLRRARHGKAKGELMLRTGSSWYIHFWKGYHHATLNGTPAYVPNSTGMACYMAGKQFRKETDEYAGLRCTGNYYIKDEARKDETVSS